MMNVNNPLLLVAVLIALLPLAASLVTGLLGKQLGRPLANTIVITLVGMSFLLSCYLFNVMVLNAHPVVDDTLYTWATAGMLHFDVAFLIDRLSATMCMIVLFVSLAVHVYTIGYMADDPGYMRFFSYVSLFTFAMLSLVLANNFLLLFFGWEGVGLVSYLLIGFWFKREYAVFGSLKAFLANRVGDVAFVLGIAAILLYFGDLNYHHVFQLASHVNTGKEMILFGKSISPMTMICLLL